MKIGKMHVKPQRVPVQFTMERDKALSHAQQAAKIQEALNVAFDICNMRHAKPRVTLLEGFNV